MADLAPGVYRGVRCLRCNAKGTVVIREDGTATETTRHRPTCIYAQQQPVHLRRRRAQVRRQERDVAKATGTRITAGSGALNGDGDSRLTGGYRVEDKSTTKDRWVLTKKFWANICQKSRKNDEEPLFVVDYLNPHRVRRLVVMCLQSWLDGGGAMPDQTLSPRLTAFHLRRDVVTPSAIPGLEPAAIVMDMSEWSHKYKGQP